VIARAWESARAFAVELLISFGVVSRRWFALLRERPTQRELSAEEQGGRLSDERRVTPSAMRVRLERMKLIRQQYVPSPCLNEPE